MPELDTTLAGVAPWLNRPTGNELSHQSFLSAFEKAQERNSPLYQIRLREAQNQLLRLDMEKQMSLLKQQDYLDSQANTRDAFAAMAQVRDWSDPAQVATVYEAIQKKPSSAAIDLGKETDARHRVALQAKEKAEALKATLTSKEKIADTAADARREAEEGRNQRFEAGLAEKQRQFDNPKATTQERERADFAKLRRQEDALNVLVKENPTRGDLKDMLKDVQTQIESWMAQHPGGQNLTLTTDKEGNVQVQMGPGKIQAGAQASIQKEMADLKNSVVQIDRAKNLLTEKDLGVAGVVWDEVVNKWVSQFAPEAGDYSVSANRVQIQKAVDTYLQTQVAKGRLSSHEREQIREALVTRNAGESLGRARAVLDSMVKVQKLDAIAKAKSGRQPLESWMFNDLTQTDIRQLLQEGILTQDEAMAWALKATKR